MILILLEPLISGARVDGERHRCVDGNALETYGHGGEGEFDSDVSTSIANGDRFGLRTETQKAGGYRVGSGGNIVDCEPPEGVRRCVGNHFGPARDADFRGGKGLTAPSVGNDACYVS